MGDYSREPTENCHCGGEHPEWDYHTPQACATSETAASAYL